MYKRIGFILMLMSIFFLCGCGHDDNKKPETKEDIKLYMYPNSVIGFEDVLCIGMNNDYK